MKILDTDILSHYLSGNERVIARRRRETEECVVSIITRIESVQGRFANVLKAENGEALLRAVKWLYAVEEGIREFTELSISDDAAAEFDRLRRIKGLRKIGRKDLLIAAIALANRSVLVTRNLKDFRLIPNLRIENWAD